MQKKDRIKQARCLYTQLQAPHQQMANDPEKLDQFRLLQTNLDKQIAILRLLQAEDRMVQNVWRATAFVLGGGFIFLITQLLNL